MNLFVTVAVSLLLAPPPAEELKKWEADIAKIEARLKEHPPGPNTVLFAGSSMIRLWNTEKAFPKYNTVNVGFGGSQTRWNTAFADRIILPFKPKVLVFYCGDNDLNSKRSVAQVSEDFAEFVKLIRSRLPETKVYILSVKPSPKRWHLFQEQSELNKRLRELCSQAKNVTFLDLVAGTLGPDGKPIAEHFQKDELHFTEKGYTHWNEAIHAALAKHPELTKTR